MSGNGEASPVALSPDQSLRRLGEQLRSLFNTDQFLARLQPSKVLHTSGQAMQWGLLNRVDFGVASGIINLPAITPDFIGVPLFMSKLSGSGLALLRPTNGANLDGSATGAYARTAGLTAMVTDGINWFSIRGSGDTSTDLQAQLNNIQFPEVVTINTSTLTLSAAHRGKKLYCTGASGCVVTVPGNVFNANDWVAGLATSGRLTLIATGATLNKPPALALSTREGFSVFELTCVSSGLFFTTGDLAIL